MKRKNNFDNIKICVSPASFHWHQKIQLDKFIICQLKLTLWVDFFLLLFSLLKVTELMLVRLISLIPNERIIQLVHAI